jgi:hypothetical protein
MEQNNKYTRGKVYTIRSHLTDKVYVGSTVNKLSKRFNDHKSKYKNYKKGKGKYYSSFKIFDIDPNCYIELFEHHSCESKDELSMREGQVIRAMDCVNKYIAGRTKAEYRQNNRQRLNEYNRQYRQNNRQTIKKQQSQKKECICGRICSLSNFSTHLKTKTHRNWIYNEWQELNHL